MQQSSYHRYGDAPGLDRPEQEPKSDSSAGNPRVVVIIAAAFLTAAGFYLVSRIVVSKSPTQTACLLMDAQR